MKKKKTKKINRSRRSGDVVKGKSQDKKVDGKEKEDRMKEIIKQEREIWKYKTNSDKKGKGKRRNLVGPAFTLLY